MDSGKHIKTVLPSDFYYVKCVNSVVDDGKLLLTFKIDAGQHKWRTLKDTFYLDEGGMVSFWDMCSGLNYEPYEDTNDPFFPLQFIGQRAKVKVDREIDGRFKVNRIIEYKVADVPAEVNVSKEKDNSHFHHTKNNRRLPI